MSRLSVQWVRGWVLIVLFALALQVKGDPSWKDIDCGWPGMTETQCLERDCIWTPQFQGPWCQYKTSPKLPSYFSLNYDSLTIDQKYILQLSLTGFVVLVAAIFWHDFLNQPNIPYFDHLIVVVFMVLAWTTRYYILEHPTEVVFDEFYFGQFANYYCTEKFVFDIHPPLAKLTHYYVGTLLGHTCDFDFQNDDHVHYQSPAQYLYLRQVSAFFGAIVVPLGYLLGRAVGYSRTTSILLGTMILCDSLLLSEARLILTDSQLFFYTTLAIYCAYKLWRSSSGTWGRTFWSVATGIACGCVFCIKFTTLAVLGWIVLLSVCSYYPFRHSVSLIRCIACMALGIAVFCIPFYFHFQLGRKSSSMDWNLDVVHQRWLEGNPNYRSSAIPHNFFYQLLYIIKRMLEQNAASTGSHPYSSFWYEWVKAKGALLSHSFHDYDHDIHEHIFIVSNPLICYSIVAAILLFIPVSLLSIRSRFYRTLKVAEVWFNYHGWAFVLGWVTNLVPYALVARTTYSYHYLPGQLYGMLLVSLILETWPHLVLHYFVSDLQQQEKLLARIRAVQSVVVLAALFYSYFYSSVFIYGYGVPDIEFSKRQWLISK